MLEKRVGISIRRAAVYGLFSAWFIATLISQDPTRKFSGFRNYDQTGLVIPDWRFFAPRPGMDDHHLLVRDELADGSLTDWREVTQMRERRLSHAFFYPERRGEKAMTDMISSLLRGVAMYQEENRDRETIQVSLAYIGLLNYITNQVPHSDKAVKTEFVLVDSTGYAEEIEPNVLFLSNRHNLTS